MKRLTIVGIILCSVVLSGCDNKKTLTDIKVNDFDSELYTKEEYNQMLDEFVTEFNETFSKNLPYDIGIEEISYVGDRCLKMEIQDFYGNNKSSANEVDENQDFLLLKIRLDKTSLKDKLNVTGSYPDDYYYFVGKKQNGKWEVLKAGMAYPGGFDLQCDLKKK